MNKKINYKYLTLLCNDTQRILLKNRNNVLLPFPHSPDLLSSFLEGFEELWCTVFPHFPPVVVLCVWSACKARQFRNSFNSYYLNLLRLRTCFILFITYLHIKPPLSHFLRESVFSGKSSSGRCRTSTSTDNSAWTSGRRRSSKADTMS